MTDHNYIRNLRLPTPEDPLRILVSACLLGVMCGVDGSNYGDYPTVLKLKDYRNVRLIGFCPEDFSFGTPREMCDIHGGTGMDVIKGTARVLTETGVDWTEGMLKASLKMLEVARRERIELAVMMDISAACGSQVIYEGNRRGENPVVQVGMGVCAARLHLNGFKVISQRDLAALELLYARVDPEHLVDPEARDWDRQEWYVGYFDENGKRR